MLKLKSIFVVFVLISNEYITLAQATNSAQNIGYLDYRLKSGNYVSSSIGEVFIGTNRSNKYIQTNGFLQPLGRFFLMSNSENNNCLLWKIWPIPAQNFVNVYVSSFKECHIKSYTVQIYNLLGQNMISKNCLEGANELDISGLSAGVYNFRLFTDTNNTASQKVIIIN